MAQEMRIAKRVLSQRAARPSDGKSRESGLEEVRAQLRREVGKKGVRCRYETL
jgi:hypothetical protein